MLCLVQDFEAAAALMTASGASELRMDSNLWEGSKIINGVLIPPDLTASLWYVRPDVQYTHSDIQ